ncbi:MAG: DUF1385 domain-containing protein [Saccharofermentanales bacterium]|jgi:uncharacterized protein YqhQ|nr:DUF1385 domain-containing protein [Bacillota bacterium]
MKRETENSCAKKTSIGGQALIEGLMMLGPERKAIASRRPDGQIVTEISDRAPMKGLANIPVVRGSVRLVSQMGVGISALLRSAEIQEEAEAEAETEPTDKTNSSKIDAWLEQHPKFALWGTVFLGLGFSVLLFILLPSLLTDGLRYLSGWQGGSAGKTNLILSAFEGVVRIIIFLSYLWFSSRIKEIRRVWMYHGSEHKTIAAYEAGEELTVENVKRHSRFHPRCGTSFMFLVMVVSILVFALVGRHGAVLNLLLRLALLPLVAGISYELIRLAGRFDNPVTRLISLPGLALQRLTTAEPEDAMLEVAISAMQAVIPSDPDSDQW